MANTIKLEVYADEVMNERFLGFGCLFVPINKRDDLLKFLIKKRCLGKKEDFIWDFDDCPYNKGCKKPWHDLNNSEIHYTKADSSKSHALHEICLSWADLIMKIRGMAYFKMFYLDLENLNMDRFGKKDIENAYNRFFRSGIIGGVKFFFKRNYNKIVINKIYHDESHAKETHEFFPWYTGHKINSTGNSKLIVENEDIIFVNSDHKVYSSDQEEYINSSQLIQFTDLFIGSTTQNIFNLSDDSFKKKLAMKVRPAIKNLLEGDYEDTEPHRDHVSISFFPNSNQIGSIKPLDMNKLIDASGEFYNKRKLEMDDYNPNQSGLDSWFK
jgi:hypothetical protein